MAPLSITDTAADEAPFDAHMDVAKSTGMMRADVSRLLENSDEVITSMQRIESAIEKLSNAHRRTESRVVGTLQELGKVTAHLRVAPAADVTAVNALKDDATRFVSSSREQGSRELRWSLDSLHLDGKTASAEGITNEAHCLEEDTLPSGDPEGGSVDISPTANHDTMGGLTMFIKDDKKMAAPTCVLQYSDWDSGRPSSDLGSDFSARDLIPPTLPEDWPQPLSPRPWLELTLDETHHPHPHDSTRGRASSYSFKRIEPQLLSRASGSSVNWRQVRLQDEFKALNPNSTLCLCVDIFSIGILIADLTLIPVVLAWNLTVEGALKWFTWCTLSYWTVDLLLNFTTGYTKHGEVELRFRQVAKRYIKSWFIIDLVVVLCDWVSTMTSMVLDVSSDTRGLRLLRVAKISRLVRIFGLLRLFRLCRIVKNLMDKYVSGAMRVFLSTCSIFVVVIWLNHMTSCFWVMVASFYSDTGMTWLDTSFTIGNYTHEYGDLGSRYVYTTAFHWSMAQMTLGAIEVVATNTFERVFNISMLIIGLIFSSTLVSSLSATLIGYQMHNSEIEEKMRMLRTYLRERCVDSVLALRIKQQCEYRIQQRAMILEAKVFVLSLLSPSLQAELRENIFKASLTSHPLFRLWGNFSMATIRELTTSVMDFKFYNPPDDIFVAGTGTSEAYYLVNGQLDYTQHPETSVVKSKTKTHVFRDRWLCEAALWSEWIHVGTAEARDPCQLLVIEADKVIRAAAKHRFILELTLQYGRQYHKCVVSAKPPNAAWPDDLSVPFTDWPSIVCAMDSSIKTTIGLDAITSMNPPPVLTGGWAFSKEQLKQEVMDGRSTVLLNTEGDPERVVSVTTLHVVGEGGQFLAQLGKWDGHHGSPIRAVVELPGSAQQMNEFPHEAAQRILSRKFHADPALVQLISSHREVSYKESPLYKVQTKYIKTVFRVRLGGPLRIPGYRSLQSSGGNRESTESVRFSARKRNSKASEGALVGKRASMGVKFTNAARSTMDSIFVEKMTLSDILGQDFRQREVFAMKQHGKVIFYMWVVQDEFELLQEEQCEKLISKWLYRLDMDPSILENVEDLHGNEESSTSTCARSAVNLDVDHEPITSGLPREPSRSSETIEQTDPVHILFGEANHEMATCSSLRSLGDEEQGLCK